MKKISLYIMALLTIGLASCKEDIESPQRPASNPQQRQFQEADIAFTANSSLTTIDLRDVKEKDAPINLGNIQIKNALPTGMRLKAVVKIWREGLDDFDRDAVKLDAEDITSDGNINIMKSKLHELYIDKFTLDPAEAKLNLLTTLYTVEGDESMASVGLPETGNYGKYQVTFEPYDDGVRIADSYFAVVANNSGTGYTAYEMTHKIDEDLLKPESELTEEQLKRKKREENVYDNPIFEVTIEALKDAEDVRLDTKYAMVSVDDKDTFMGDNSKTDLLYGKSDEDGKLKKGGPLFVGPYDDGAARYKVTIDMRELNIIIQEQFDRPLWYLYTNPNKNMKYGDNETSRNYMFYKKDATTFTYTTFWKNDDNGVSYMNVKVWDAKAMNAKNENAAWGYEKRSGERPESGKLTQGKYWLGPKAEGWYTMTVTMDEKAKPAVHNYEFTAIAAPTESYTSISIIAEDGTEKDLVQNKAASHNWNLLDYEFTEETKVKFRANHDNSKTWGGNGSQSINVAVYTLPQGDQYITVPAGKYDIYLNDITGDWSILQLQDE